MVDLMDLTVEDLRDIEELQKFRREAESLYYTVVHNQLVPLVLDDQNRYEIWCDANNAEYLALSGGEWVWQARYLHQNYDVPINIDGIYRMMVYAYEHEKDKNKKGRVNDCKDAIGYFRSYVSKIKVHK